MRLTAAAASRSAAQISSLFYFHRKYFHLISNANRRNNDRHRHNSLCARHREIRNSPLEIFSKLLLLLLLLMI